MPINPPPGTPFDSLLEPDAPLADPEAEALIAQIKETADKLVRDRTSRGDIKLLATAFRELRHCFRVFDQYRGTRKVTIFGSARTKPDHPAYQAAVEFGRRIREAGYMVITGAAAGIMEAGHVGAGRDHSFGLNILLPFESGANQVIHGDPKLMNMRYFFTRKLIFVKESDAVVLFPGGFGTHDEAFESLTLIQTGKSHIFPLVMVDEPGGTYWSRWQQFVEEELLGRGYLSPADMSFFHVTDSVDEAVNVVQKFYRVYHSMRYVKGDLVLRLQQPLSTTCLAKIQTDFADIVASGTFEQCPALPQEANEPNLVDLPRLKFRFDRQNMGRLRMMIDVLNEEE